jgi:hypothetical protein
MKTLEDGHTDYGMLLTTSIGQWAHL